MLLIVNPTSGLNGILYNLHTVGRTYNETQAASAEIQQDTGHTGQEKKVNNLPIHQLFLPNSAQPPVLLYLRMSRCIYMLRYLLKVPWVPSVGSKELEIKD